MVGASNENSKSPVAPTALTVRKIEWSTSVPVVREHCTVVLEVQLVVRHELGLIWDETDEPNVPKLSPVTVTDVPAESGTLCADAPDTSGPSKENAPIKVPATAWTVNPTKGTLVAVAAELPNPHTTDVEDDHDEVAQPTCATADDAVGPTVAKLSPVTVTEVAPVNGQFC